jgi:hypothetical protein
MMTNAGSSSAHSVTTTRRSKKMRVSTHPPYLATLGAGMPPPRPTPGRPLPRRRRPKASARVRELARLWCLAIHLVLANLSPEPTYRKEKNVGPNN